MRDIKIQFILKNKCIGNEVFGKLTYSLDEILEGITNEYICEKACEIFSPANGVEADFEIIAKRKFTGLQDKNLEDIYEGDILVAKNKKDSKNNDWIGIVEDNNYGWLALKYKEYINPSWLGALSTPINEPQNASWIMSNCEVIGNIYENSHLLNNNSLF